MTFEVFLVVPEGNTRHALKALACGVRYVAFTVKIGPSYLHQSVL